MQLCCTRHWPGSGWVSVRFCCCSGACQAGLGRLGWAGQAGRATATYDCQLAIICNFNDLHTKHFSPNETHNKKRSDQTRQAGSGAGAGKQRNEAVAEAEAEAGIELAWTNKHVKYFRVAAACSK